MRIVILGAGALGGLIGARLSQAGEDVTFLEANVARARLLDEEGLFLSESESGEHHVKVKVVTTLEGQPPADLLFVAVKAYQTEGAVRAALPVIGEGTWILSTQNGVGNVERIRKVLDTERILTGITYHSIQHTGPNRMRYRTGIRPIQMAPVNRVVTDEVRAIGEVFCRAGMPTQVVEEVDTVVWQKLLHNSVINPVSALTGMSCSELLDDPDLQAFMRALCDEIVGVMRARGTPLEDAEDPYRPLLKSQKALGKNRPSMWQDFTRGLLTEVDALNGGIVAEAEKLGVRAPLNWAITQLVHSRERQQSRRQARGAQLLEEVRAAQAKLPSRPSGREPFGGMPSGRVPLESAPKLKELIHGYYRGLGDAGRQGNVAWCSAFGPVELLRALGFTPYFPENHAALIGASRLTARYISLALADGFSPFASSEMASDVGAMLAHETPLAGLHGLDGVPPPQVLVYNTNVGPYVARWFEYYANRLGAPLLGLHPPAVLDEVEKIEVDAAVQQTLRLADRLQKVSRRALDHDRLAEVVDRSSRACRLWNEILDLAAQTPSPLTFFDTLIHVAPAMLMRGTEEAIQYYEILLAELKHRIAEKIAAVPGERLRFYWDGVPIWCALRPLASLFLEEGIAVVGSWYSQSYALEGLHRDNPIETMAAAYTSIFPNRSREFKVRYVARQFERYGVDAAIYHDARTAPDHSPVRSGIHIRLKRDTGVPPIVIEADTHDLRLVSIEHIRGQLREFVEHRRQAARSGPGHEAAA